MTKCSHFEAVDNEACDSFETRRKIVQAGWSFVCRCASHVIDNSTSRSVKEARGGVEQTGASPATTGITNNFSSNPPGRRLERFKALQKFYMDNLPANNFILALTPPKNGLREETQSRQRPHHRRLRLSWPPHRPRPPSRLGHDRHLRRRPEMRAQPPARV